MNSEQGCVFTNPFQNLPWFDILITIQRSSRFLSSNKSEQMLGMGEADKNKPENTEYLLMQMEKQFVRAFRTISELKGTSRRSKKKSSRHSMTFRGPKSGGCTVNQSGIWSRTIQKLCLHTELTLQAANNPKILSNYPKLQERELASHVIILSL